jgi:hypothetical protein
MSKETTNELVNDRPETQARPSRGKLERQLEEANQTTTGEKSAEPLSPEKNKDAIFRRTNRRSCLEST